MNAWVKRFNVQPSRRPKKFTRLGRAAGLIETETLMLSVQPQRHQGTKITVKFIGSLSIIDLMI